jgi:hypothetical protein
MATHLLEQVPPLLGREPGKLLFGGRQQTLKPDDHEIVEQECANVLGASSPVFPLNATDPFADGGLDFSLRFSSRRQLRDVRQDLQNFSEVPRLDQVVIEARVK